MLIQFSVGNYRSFNKPVTFSMIATPINEYKEDSVFRTNNLELLKSSIVYGANASGKSNLLQAMDFMRSFVLGSAKESNVNEKILIERYRLSTETENEPSFFEISFIQDNIPYRYGFEVDNNLVHHEWLFSSPKNKERKLFTREGQDFFTGSHFKEGKFFTKYTRENALLLSVAAQYNIEIARNILKWFSGFNIISGLSNRYMGLTIDKLEDGNFKNKILRLINMSDLDIINIYKEKGTVDIPFLSDNVKELLKNGELINLKTSHKKYNDKKEETGLEVFDLELNESHGTQKIFNFAVPLIDTLNKGKVLIIDEFDSQLHPLITRNIIKLFNNKKNLRNAQLIIASHDITLLNKEFFRRDQIWFADKDRYGATDLYSLVKYKVRNDASYDKHYINGNYGAVPYTDNFEHFYEEIYEK